MRGRAGSGFWASRAVGALGAAAALGAFVAAPAAGLDCPGGWWGSTPPPVPGAVPPVSGYGPGPHAIDGIGGIPRSMVKLSRERMQRKAVVFERLEGHARRVTRVACESYIQSGDCASQPGRIRYQERLAKTATGTYYTVYGTKTETGTAPFFKLVDLEDTQPWGRAELAGMPEVKIVNFSSTADRSDRLIGDGNPPYLVINSVGNNSGSHPFPDGQVSAERMARIKRAIGGNRLILVAGWDKDADGRYIPHRRSSTCGGNEVREGCVWARYEFEIDDGSYYGTSYSAAQFTGALASVLAIAPDTTPRNLAGFAKACLKRRGEGIEELLRTSGGLGVADFACMGDIVAAMANLPGGTTANLTVNGRPVTLSGRDIAFSFAGGAVPEPEPEEEKEESGFFFGALPNGGGEENLLLVAGYRSGDLFASLSGGTRDDFFGFAREHGQVRQAGVAAGHGNLFLTLTEQVSSGGSVISGAKGRSLTVTARETVSLTDATDLTAALAADRFLGGEASLPFGTTDLGAGGWRPRLSLLAKTDVIPAVSLTARAEISGDERYALFARFRMSW